jgi:hypothetical protein
MTIRDLLHQLDQSPAFHALGDLPLWAGILIFIAASAVASYLSGFGRELAADLLAQRKPRRLLSRRQERKD